MSVFSQFEREIIDQLKARIEVALHQIGDKLVSDAVKRLENNGKHAFGNLIDSIAYDIFDEIPLRYRLKFGSSLKAEPLRHKNVGDTSAETLGVNYAQYVEEGREPGKLPPYKPIFEWAEQKRHKFRESGRFFGDADIAKVAKGVQFKIGKKGIDPFPFLSWAVEQNQAYIEQKIAEALSL